MTETLTLKQLVQHVAPVYFTPAELKTLARQIQHWTVCGLFDQAGVSIPDKHVGRGRARRYPKKAVFWCALFRALNRYGGAPDEIAKFLRELRPHAAKVKRAMKGDGPDVAQCAAIGADGGTDCAGDHNMGHRTLLACD